MDRRRGTNDDVRSVRKSARRERGGSPERLGLALFTAGLCLYLALFYGSRMPSLDQSNPPTRAEMLTSAAVLPDEVVAGWFGSPAEFTFADRLPILLAATAALCIAAAAGWLALRLVRADLGLTRLECGLFALGVGLNLISTYVLAVGLLGWLQRPEAFLVPAAAVLLAAGFAAWRRRSRLVAAASTADTAVAPGDASAKRPLTPGDASTRRPLGATAVSAVLVPVSKANGLSPHWLWLGTPFVVVIVLGGVLPPTDFDVREYHLQAPKEFFQRGRIEFLPHNIYANMTLGAELLAIPAMAVLGDWWRGALVGKTLLALFAPLTALAVYCAGKRWFNSTAGVVGALAYLSIPWIGRVSMDGLNEGAAGWYLFLAVYALLLWRQVANGATAELSGATAVSSGATAESSGATAVSAVRDAASTPHGSQSRGTQTGRLLLCGYLAGAAVACKYPAALFVLIPLGGWVALTAGERRWRSLAAFGLAAALACGLWFGKNAALTGNPTYPLLAGVFGGETRTPERNAQFVAAHSPPGYSPDQLAASLADVAWRSEWLSPLVWPLAALTLSAAALRRWSRPLWLYLLFVLAAWWLVTHRIDRFWIPALPVAALLAGVGATMLWRWLSPKGATAATLALVVLALFANFPFVATGRPLFDSLARLRSDPARVDPWHLYLNEHVPPGGAVLLVGDAQPFDLTVPAYYNTVFDDSLFVEIVEGRSAEEIRARLAELRITHVYVHWDELARYRDTYDRQGFARFIQPEVFQRLVAEGVLDPPLPPREGRLRQIYPVAGS